MDALAKEIAQKRKEIEENTLRNHKFFRRGDVEKRREENYLAEQAELEELRSKKQLERIEASVEREQLRIERAEKLSQEKYLNTLAAENESLTEKELDERLKKLEQPIILSGETLVQRKARLRLVELQQNKQTKLQPKEPDLNTIDMTINLADCRINHEKLQLQIYKYLRYLLSEWESHSQDLESTRDRAKQDLQTLFNRLKLKNLPSDMVENLAMSLYYCQQKNYLKASDNYLKLSIGNLAWPIGLKEVGIHERAARDRIVSKKVANVLVDEATRKWLQSVKRCLTFAQERWPPDEESLRMD